MTASVIPITAAVPGPGNGRAIPCAWILYSIIFPLKAIPWGSLLIIDTAF